MVPRLMLTTPFSEYGYQLPLTSGAHEFSYASGGPARHETPQRGCDHRFFRSGDYESRASKRPGS